MWIIVGICSKYWYVKKHFRLLYLYFWSVQHWERFLSVIDEIVIRSIRVLLLSDIFTYGIFTRTFEYPLFNVAEVRGEIVDCQLFTPASLLSYFQLCVCVCGFVIVLITESCLRSVELKTDLLSITRIHWTVNGDNLVLNIMTLEQYKLYLEDASEASTGLSLHSQLSQPYV